MQNKFFPSEIEIGPHTTYTVVHSIMIDFIDREGPHEKISRAFMTFFLNLVC